MAYHTAMARLLEFETASGHIVLFEEPASGEMQQLSADGADIVRKAGRTFEAAAGTLRDALAALLKVVTDIELPADSIEVEVGVKASAKAGFYLASADSEAQIKMKLTWNKRTEAGPPATKEATGR